MREHYLAVIADLKAQRSECVAQITRLDNAIQTMEQLIGPAVDTGGVAFSQDFRQISQAAVDAPENRYRGMSVRWAILLLLAEHTSRPLKTGEIAEALIAGGMSSESKNFASNVSAVLSTMKSKNEVAVTDVGTYWITQEGRDCWGGIKRSATYQSRLFASVP